MYSRDRRCSFVTLIYSFFPFTLSLSFFFYLYYSLSLSHIFAHYVSLSFISTVQRLWIMTAIDYRHHRPPCTAGGGAFVSHEYLVCTRRANDDESPPRPSPSFFSLLIATACSLDLSSLPFTYRVPVDYRRARKRGERPMSGKDSEHPCEQLPRSQG